MPCAIAHCPRFKAARAGDFRGSELCLEHHMERVRPVLEAPMLAHFLVDNIALGILHHFANLELSGFAPHIRNALNFLRTVQPFKQYEKNLRISRAKMLHDKFVRRRAAFRFFVADDDGAGDALCDAVEQGIPRGSRDLFDACCAHACALLRPCFAAFLQSAHWRAYLSVVLPSAAVLRRAHIRPPSGVFNSDQPVAPTPLSKRTSSVAGSPVAEGVGSPVSLAASAPVHSSLHLDDEEKSS